MKRGKGKTGTERRKEIQGLINELSTEAGGNRPDAQAEGTSPFKLHITLLRTTLYKLGGSKIYQPVPSHNWSKFTPWDRNSDCHLTRPAVVGEARSQGPRAPVSLHQECRRDGVAAELGLHSCSCPTVAGW